MKINELRSVFGNSQTMVILDEKGCEIGRVDCSEPNLSFDTLRVMLPVEIDHAHEIVYVKTEPTFPWYFTFGSDPEYPFDRDQFVVVYAYSRSEAIVKYQVKYPNRPDSASFNAADCYSQDEWKPISEKYYSGIIPSDIIGK